jgi:hypothetical protein
MSTRKRSSPQPTWRRCGTCCSSSLIATCRTARAAEDRQATALLQEIRDYAKDLPKPGSRRLQSDDVLLPIQIRRDAIELRIFSTIMTIGTPQDITLQELRIETFFPADAPSEWTWRALMQ